MGDVLSLIEKAEQAIDKDEALEMQRKLMKNEFTLEDFRNQLRQVRRLGSFDKLLDMLPSGLFGGFKMTPEQNAEMENKLKLTDAIINSMTPDERRDHNILNAWRRKRIAKGSGVTVAELNNLLNRFNQMQQMLKKMGKFQKMMARGGVMPKGFRF